MHVKQRMIALLEPVSSEPHVLNKQLEQVEARFLVSLLSKHFQIDLLCDELDENRSALDEINASGNRVVDFTNDEVTKGRVQEELCASAAQFSEIEEQLHERRANLNATLNAGRALQNVENAFDKWHRDAEEKMKKLSLAVPRGEEEVRQQNVHFKSISCLFFRSKLNFCPLRSFKKVPTRPDVLSSIRPTALLNLVPM